MCRELAGKFRVIVPEYAKSAATLIALASDVIIMGLPSELGPIDAQLQGPGPGGATFQTSAQTFLDEFEKIKTEVEEKGFLSPAYMPLLEGVNLGFLGMCRNDMERSKQFAEKWLKEYMCKDDSVKAADIADKLCDAHQWLSHGKVINAKEAVNLGINVEKLNKDDKLWEKIWYLHCCYTVFFMQNSGACKIFESEIVSLPFG